MRYLMFIFSGERIPNNKLYAIHKKIFNLNFTGFT